VDRAGGFFLGHAFAVGAHFFPVSAAFLTAAAASRLCLSSFFVCCFWFALRFFCFGDLSPMVHLLVLGSES
jgi:hypothetical protein